MYRTQDRNRCDRRHDARIRLEARSSGAKARRVTRRSHRRASCFGGSHAMSDPMVIEIAGDAGRPPAVPVPIHGALASTTVEVLAAEEPTELDELAQLDEQLQIAAVDSATPHSAARG